ncbi:DUF1538 domain-containing protein [Rubrobacter indicoceani]|uniref:DUF1538 domain-containing protein n=1 Tax=Rubrobacter indicoceani TaxID=2051957 RepID=UPI000E5ABF80|nr:DUF1538 domain-containing protein [Rubrobacter indicoceani]
MGALKREFLEVFYAVLPIIFVIALLQVSLIHMPLADFFQFLLAATMTIVGLALFLFGVKLGLLPLGESLGSYLPSRGFVLILLFGFLLGFVITVAEPDVRIFASQINDASEGLTSENLLIYSISLGVGISVVVAMIRTVFDLRLIHILIPCYVVVFTLSFFVPEDYFSIAFDAGGVTTGPITVPFLIALNVGVVSVLAGRNGVSQGFGLVALASIGPIIAVMILGVLFS